MKRAIIHIGAEKTGSKAIQSALRANKAALEKAGFLFPEGLGPGNHVNLVAACLEESTFDNVKAHIVARTGFSPRKLRERIARDLERELQLNKGWNTIIVSSELIHSRLVEDSEIDRLISFFSGHVDEIAILCFIRRQDVLALSRFSTALRSGYRNFDGIFDNISRHHYFTPPKNYAYDDFEHYYNYENLLKRFLRKIDRKNIKVIRYPLRSGDGFSCVPLFAEEAGLPAGLLGDSDSYLNQGMSAQAQFVMSLVNRHARIWRDSGERNKALKKVHGEIEASVKGEPRRVSRADAMDFVSRFADSNEWVRETFFPESAELFSGDFSFHPEEADYSHFAPELESQAREFLSRLESHSRENGLKLLFNHVRRHFRRIA